MLTKGLGPVNALGFQATLEYNGGMDGLKNLRLAAWPLLAIAIGACSRTGDLPADPRLENYIRVAAGCAYADRAFSADPGLFQQEIAEIGLPPDWKALSDSLIAKYGTDPRFWYRVYSRILEQSRR
jgi:hypothetical protein